MEQAVVAKKNYDLKAGMDTVAACNAGATIDILDVSQRKTGMKITILGKDSDVFRETQRDNIDAHNARVALARQKGKPTPFQSQDEQEQEGIDLLVACTVGWEGVAIGEEVLVFNVPNARRLYKEFPEVRRQVDSAIMDLEIFMKG